MIEKMKIVHVVATASNKEELLDGLRSLELLHLRQRRTADPACLERFSNLSAMASRLQEYAPAQPCQQPLSDADFDRLCRDVDDAFRRREALEARRSEAKAAAEALEKWGSFDPAVFDELRTKGIDLHIYRSDKKTIKAMEADKELRFVRLSPVDKMDTVAVLGELPADYSAMEFKLPAKGLDELKEQVSTCEQGIEECKALFQKAASHLPSFQQQLLKAQNDSEYSAVSNTLESSDGLVWLTGYLPAAQTQPFMDMAAEKRWAWAMDDPADDDEHVPTKVKYTKVTRLMIPVFDILGVVPGYREYDISFWFLAFFSLFFAMILGDAGYGVLMLLGALVFTLKLKTRPLPDIIQLLWLLSVTTILWGALTGTWFGLEAAMRMPFLKALVIPSFANYPQYFGVAATDQQNTIMKFCFILGTTQLVLACVMNMKRKLGVRDLSWVADLGWLLSICAMYFLTMLLVIGENIPLAPVGLVVGIGFVLVVVFGGMSPDKSFSQGLKAGVGDAFTVFLNTISAFGNVMSYIRLFAVGMASLAIAQSFNNMAAGFKGPLVIAGALIMIIGHALNLVMGLLSVVVHGVRLNLLEFSGQLGMEWAGTAYEPFKNLNKIKK